MAKPTLTPAQTTSVIVLPENYTVPGAGAEKDALISSFPFGIYANVDYWFDGNGDADETQVDTFLQGAADQVAYTYRKLGGDVLDIELTKEQVFAAYEEAVLEYSYILNIHQTKNTLSNSLGNSTGSFNEDGAITEDTVDNTVVNKKTHVSLKYPRFDFAYARRVTEGISEEVGVGGSTTVYSASIDITDGVQDYDIQAAITSDADWQAALGFTGASDANKILVKKVFYKTPKAMWSYYGYYNGVNVLGNLSTYGQYADDSTYEIVPVWHNKMQAKAYEESLYVRSSHYSYELRNNKLRLFPVPTGNGYPEKVWIEFVYPRDTWSDDAQDGNVGSDGVNNMNTMPLQNIPYKNINSIGKQWIRRFGLALAKEMLGLVRSKFSSIPIPGNDISMNGDALVSAGKEEQEALRTELKETLDELTYTKLLESDAETVENSNRIMTQIPNAIFTG
tara:strand:- start:7000 stop:8349 length:1350 start_codon:yes stop_codon:yes gene_type:complete